MQFGDGSSRTVPIFCYNAFMLTTPPRGFKWFDHTADIGIEVWGDSFEAIFEEAARALFSLITDLDSVEPKETVLVELKAQSGEELFLVWLKELLFIFETKQLLLSKFQISHLAFNRLQAKVTGERLNHSKHQLGHEVKAVTRHLFEFKKTASGFFAKVIVDI